MEFLLELWKKAKTFFLGEAKKSVTTFVKQEVAEIKEKVAKKEEPVVAPKEAHIVYDENEVHPITPAAKVAAPAKKKSSSKKRNTTKKQTPTK